MTSIAVTASIWANASEAALLVASFMSISLDLGAIHRGAPRRAATILWLLGTPRDDDPPFVESPLRRISTVPRSNSNAAGIWLARSGILRATRNFWAQGVTGACAPA